MAEPDDASGSIATIDQWPKNSHSRRITGIGTPTSQSKIPFPILASMNSRIGFKNAEGNVRFQQTERKTFYQCPVFDIDDHGSAGGFASPFCNSSIECRSGERTNAICPSRGGRLMVTPIFISRAQVA
jgi:hypothetical protein